MAADIQRSQKVFLCAVILLTASAAAVDLRADQNSRSLEQAADAAEPPRPLPITDPKVQEMLRWHERIVAARLKIHSGQGILVYRGQKESHFAFEGKKRRVKTDGFVHVLTETQLLNRHIPLTKKYHEKVRIRPANDVGGLMKPMDIRILGMTPSPVSILYSDEFANWYGRDSTGIEGIVDVDVREISEAGLKLVYIETHYRADSAVVKLWIDPERGPNIIRQYRAHVGEVEGTETLYAQTVEVKLDQIDAIWFPRQVEVATQLGGKRVMRELQLLKKARFNIDVDDALFTLASMELPPGGLVNDFSDPKKEFRAQVWTGTAAIPVSKARRKAKPRPRPRPPKPRGGNPLNLLLSLSLTLFVVIVVAVVFAVRRAGPT
jgi:hypothetical protein